MTVVRGMFYVPFVIPDGMNITMFAPKYGHDSCHIQFAMMGEVFKMVF